MGKDDDDKVEMSALLRANKSNPGKKEKVETKPADDPDENPDDAADEIMDDDEPSFDDVMIRLLGEFSTDIKGLSADSQEMKGRLAEIDDKIKRASDAKNAKTSKKDDDEADDEDSGKSQAVDSVIARIELAFPDFSNTASAPAAAPPQMQPAAVPAPAPPVAPPPAQPAVAPVQAPPAPVPVSSAQPAVTTFDTDRQSPAFREVQDRVEGIVKKEMQVRLDEVEQTLAKNREETPVPSDTPDDSVSEKTDDFGACLLMFLAPIAITLLALGIILNIM